MRLVIIFEGQKFDDNNINDDDIILIQDYSMYMEYKKKYKTYLLDLTLGYESEDLYYASKRFFHEGNELYKISNIIYFKLFAPIYSVLAQIKNILLNNNLIDELLLIGGSNHIFFSINKSEGEGQKKYYYSAWLFNPVIYNFFYKELKINWVNKKSKILFYIMNFLREELYLLNTIIRKIFKSILLKRKIKNRISLQNVKIAVINFKLQYRHISQLLKKENIEREIYYIVPHSWKNYDLDKNIISREVVSLKELIKLINRANDKRNFKNISNKLKIFNEELLFNKCIFNRILRQTFFEYLVDSYEIRETVKLIESNDKVLVTNMTFGLDIVSVHSVAENLNIKHINYQYVTMNPMLFPNFNLSDEYYLYSKNTYEKYKKYSNIFKYYLPIKNKPNFKNKNPNQNKKVGIFTQPDRYTERYLYILKELSRRDKQLSEVEFIIKPHYRQNSIEEFEKIVKFNDKMKIVDSEVSCEEIILECDFIISITSSVIFESLMLGVMSVIINIDNLDDDIIYNGGNLFPNINFVVNSVDGIVDIIENIDYYSNEFYNRYDKLLNNNVNDGDFY